MSTNFVNIDTSGNLTSSGMNTESIEALVKLKVDAAIRDLKDEMNTALTFKLDEPAASKLYVKMGAAIQGQNPNGNLTWWVFGK
jgi:hypothetical protein